MHLMKRWQAVPLAALVALIVGVALLGTGTMEVRAGGATAFTMSVDCDTSTAAIDAACPAVAGARTVNIVLTNNSGAASTIGSFQMDIVAEAQPDMNPTGVPTTTTTGPPGSFNCSLLPPAQDSDPNPNIARSFLGCFGAATSFPIADGASFVLASVAYTATANASTVRLENAVAGDEVGIELMSCNPVITTEGTCFQATFGGGTGPIPTSTPTPTASPTGVAGSPTPCTGPCPTATPLTFSTVTPTPCDPNCPSPTPGGEVTPPPGGETPVPPGGTPGAGNQTPGAGGTPGSGTITPPDTGDGTGAGGYNWTNIALMLLIAVGAGALAGGSYLFAASRRD
jgi:hypothetical protein